jgi:hypothetical protein
MNTASEPAFVGWHRPNGGAWREVCYCATEREAWDKLLGLAAPGDKLVLPKGRHPDARTRQRSLFKD